MQSNVLNHLVISPESTYGTAVTPGNTIPVRPGGGIVTNVNRTDTEQMRAELQANYNLVDGVASHAGSYTSDFLFDMIGFIFRSAFGGLSSGVKGGESVVYEHAFSESATKIGFTAEQKIGALINRYAGVLFPSFKLTADPANPAIAVEFAAIAKSLASASAVTPSPTNQGVFSFNHADVKIDTTSVTDVRKFELEFNNQAQMIATLNSSKNPNGYVIGKSMVNINMELVLETAQVAEFTAMLDQTERRFDLDLIGPTIGNASNYALNVGIPRVQYLTGEPTYLPDGAAILPLTAKALSSSGAYFDEFKLTNLKANYT